MRIGSISQYIKNADVPRIHRALACSISNFGKYFLLLYVGANPSTSAKTIYIKLYLDRFAIMQILMIPKNLKFFHSILVWRMVKIISLYEAHEMLKNIKSNINYCGLIEGFLFED